jgi:hypothetical protein
MENDGIRVLGVRVHGTFYSRWELREHTNRAAVMRLDFAKVQSIRPITSGMPPPPPVDATCKTEALSESGTNWQSMSDSMLLGRKIMKAASLVSKHIAALRRQAPQTLACAQSLLAAARQLARKNQFAESDAKVTQCLDVLYSAV